MEVTEISWFQQWANILLMSHALQKMTRIFTNQFQLHSKILKADLKNSRYSSAILKLRRATPISQVFPQKKMAI
jgi:hypothetical protein